MLLKQYSFKIILQNNFSKMHVIVVHVTCHLSHVTCRMSYTTCQVSPVPNTGKQAFYLTCQKLQFRVEWKQGLDKRIKGAGSRRM